MAVGVCLLAAVAAVSSPPVVGNTMITSFSKAKRLLLEQVYGDRRVTFYCGCRFRADKYVDYGSCGYAPRTATSKRAHRIEWEHVCPAEAFGRSFVEWREGHPDCVDSKGRAFKGRNCASKVSMLYRQMQADLYNLVPAIGEVNQDRSNFSMAEIPGEAREFGKCDVEIHGGKVEPRPEIRGDVARIYQYMDGAYPGRGIISAKNRRMFEAWSRLDPVDALECDRARRIAKIQGNSNSVVERQCPAVGR